MSIITILIIVCSIALAVILILFLSLRKKMLNSDVAKIEKLRKGTKEKKFDSSVFYQKLYVRFQSIPFIKRYLFKIRRRIEINNIDDEFLTRLQCSKIIFRAMCIIIPLSITIILLTHKNLLLMTIILIFELFMIDSITDSMVDKIDNNLLSQQIDFFAAMRHAYHETNMVGEAIYVTAQDTDAVEISRQAEKIYDILNTSEPEIELEKYYDVAPNNYLKEFAGISYLTQEFGDRKLDGESLYLKNLENITQEMQLEILKRDKLNYTFQSLSVISIVPLLFLEPLKNWAVSSFEFTKSFYEGKAGLLVQIIIMVATFICYILVRELKDNGSVKRVQNNQNPWQAKLYKKPFIKKVVNEFMPKQNTTEYRKEKKLLKDAASSQKIEWIYVTRLTLSIGCFIVAIVLSFILHQVQINYVYTQPTSDYDLIGGMSSAQEKKAIARTKKHNIFLNMFKGKTKTTLVDIQKAMKKSKEYKDSSEDEITTESKIIFTKLQKVNSEYIKWFEILIAVILMYIGYCSPILLLLFQIKMRQMSMEDEVMQFQVIILMLMRLERVDVEMILEWLERYADIFKEPISKCLNNYESGAWEALEELKDEVTYQDFIRIVESLQSSVEKVPIKEAFEELDSDRDYYKNKRKESNDRLISKKGMIGKVIGFGPMIIIFVGYLIVPLIFIGMTSMSSTMSSMQTMNK